MHFTWPCLPLGRASLFAARFSWIFAIFAKHNLVAGRSCFKDEDDMNTSFNSPSVRDSSERRLVLLWLLFLFTVILVSPTAFATPDAEDENVAPMSCGDSCESAPELPELGVFVIPAENSTTVRSLAQVPGMRSVLYACTDLPSLSHPLLKASDPPPIFVPLLVMGPAHAAHAPPVA